MKALEVDEQPAELMPFDQWVVAVLMYHKIDRDELILDTGVTVKEFIDRAFKEPTWQEPLQYLTDVLVAKSPEGDAKEHILAYWARLVEGYEKMGVDFHE